MNEFLMDYVIVDIETTGLSRYNNEIIEISALKVRNNKIVDEFSSLIKPSRPISYSITKLTGISNEMVKNSPSVDYVLPLFLDFIQEDTILGHNLSFDFGFLNVNLDRHHLKMLTNNKMDTLYLSRRIIKLDSYKLSSIASFFGIDTKGSHRGSKDCLITYEVYNRLNMIVNR